VPQFTLPNIASGGSITVTAPDLAGAQAAAANQTGVTVAQQQAGGTFGANTGGGVGMGGGPTPSTAIPGYGGGDLSGLAQFAAQTSGVTQAQLAQQKQEFDAQLAFAQQQLQQLGIPQLQINQFLANLQQQQFQAQLTLAQQAQEYNQAATTASLTGWFTPPSPVPSVQQWTGGGGLPGTPGALPGAGGGGVASASTAGTPQITAPGSMTWDQLSNMMRSAAGSNYNDAAKQLAFSMRASGGQQWPNSGAVPLNLSPAQMNQIIALGTGNQFGSYGALTGQAAPTPTAAAAPATPTAAPGAPATPAQPQMTEAQREFLANLSLQQGQLGQQYLATAAQLQGPQNTFQLSNYLRGAQGNPNVPTYLQSLANNIGMPAFQATGSTAPTVQSAAGIAGQLGGTQSATPGWDYNQTLGAIQNIMSRGAQSLGPGALERLTPDELAAFGSGLGAAGGSLPAFMQQYQQSRVGQQAPVVQTSLA